MLHVKRHITGFSRLMIGLFAVQILAAGICLLTPESHAVQAMDMQHMSGDMAAHCESNSKTESGHANAMACAHCDLPDELICSKVSSFTADIDLSAVVFAGAAMNLPIATSIDLAVRPPTGPPNSASLLYQTSRRILI